MNPEVSVGVSPTGSTEKRDAEKAPLYVEATCANCGDTLFRYRWETRNKDWLHAGSKRNSCQRTTRAKAEVPS